jgi:hypothetical protein
MVNNIHALVRDFLQQKTVVAQETGESPARYKKAGVVPYIHENGFRFYVMKPRGMRPDLGEPPFQLCKGTRMYRVDGRWRDMRDEVLGDEKETLAETALREGIEELGVRLENIIQLIDMGPYRFSSATTGKDKEMWLFAAEMNDMADFASDSELAPATIARKWLTSSQFEVVGRPDHHYILRDIEGKLKAYHKE